MLFNSPEFIFIFLPISCLLFYYIRILSQNAQLFTIITLSVLFYGYWNIKDLPVLLFILASNYTFARIIQSTDNVKIQKIAYLSGILIALLTLAHYKYLYFILNSILLINDASLTNNTKHLPIGISFYTFTAIAFLTDVKARRINKFNIFEYGATITYFPHLVAGPILYHQSTIPQLRVNDGYFLSAEKIMLFLFLFSVGLFKKVVLADNIANFSDPVFDQASIGYIPNTGEAWQAALCYSLQLYYDFSGYSDMAIGLACLFSIKIPLNFNSPYKSQNITEFWQRWHISLGYFFRTYVYIPLGGNRKGSTNSMINIFIVMALCGLWHGAGWTFIIWGCLHGAAMIIQRLFSSRNIIPHTIFTKYISIIITFTFVTITWIIFRSDSTQTALIIIKALVINSAGTMQNIPHSGVEMLITILLLNAWLMPNSYQIVNGFKVAISLNKWNDSNWLANRYALIFGHQNSIIAYGYGFLSAILFMFGCIYILINGKTQYLYFNF